jgi:3-vinyl bacteriochlorophyllide hydratase
LLYTEEQKKRRDETRWTLVQGILAPFSSSCSWSACSGHPLSDDRGWLGGWRPGPSSFKTLVLYTIMITGSIWEKVVFGKWLFAAAFFWEDVFSMLVLALHTAVSRTPSLRLGRPGANR